MSTWTIWSAARGFRFRERRARGGEVSEICQAVAANLAKADIRIKLQAESRATYFPKGFKREMGFFMLGWSLAGHDAHNPRFTVSCATAP